MNPPLTLETTIVFTRDKGQRKRASQSVKEPLPVGRLPRITKLMALALKFGKLLEEGVTSHAALARLGQVTRARMTQILNLLHLAPDIQEELLFLPVVTQGRASITLRDLQPLCTTPDWNRQRRLWMELLQVSQK